MSQLSTMTLPDLTRLDDGRYQLAADWHVIVGEYDITGLAITVTIPKGFISDGASIPKWLWPLCGKPNARPRLYAAIIHDWMYTVGSPTFTRSEADWIYFETLRRVGVPTWKAWAEYAGVRLFGGAHFNEKGTTADV